MTLRQKLKGPEKSHKAWLFSVVFTSKLSTAAVLLLLVSFCIQPFHQAAAAEEGVADESESTGSESTDVAEQIEEEVPETIAEEVEPEESNIVPESQEAEVVENTEEQEVSESEVTENEVAENETSTTTPDAEEEIIDGGNVGSGSESNSSSTPDTTNGTSNESENNNSVNEQENEAEQATTSEQVTESEEEITEPVIGEVNEIQPLVTDENFYQFSKKSCVPVGDGTYHCTSKESSLYDASSVVYADRGASGNMEIFLRTSRGTVEQITDNNFDDTAPHYDAESGQIVWQRLINGRYQVITYSIDEAEETQLTFSKTNNMEPKASAAGIVWQAWDSNDWEIMYFDGEYAEQITDNLLQDVTPVIQDGYIVWSIIGGEEQEAKVYSLDSGEILTISGYEGGTIANPRFVLVYDTKFENGDVITQGFDPETGLSKPIAAQPAQDPVDLPHNDPTGEIRALIQKSSDDEDDSIEQSGNEGGNGTSTTLDLAGAKVSKDSGTLDLSQASSSDIYFDAAPTTTIKKLELTDFDLVITGASSSDDNDDVASSTTSS